MINSLESILALIAWLEKNDLKIEIKVFSSAPLELHGKDIIGSEQCILIGTSGWVTRKTKYVDATIYTGEIDIKQGTISDSRT